MGTDSAGNAIAARSIGATPGIGQRKPLSLNRETERRGGYFIRPLRDGERRCFSHAKAQIKKFFLPPRLPVPTRWRSLLAPHLRCGRRRRAPATELGELL